MLMLCAAAVFLSGSRVQAQATEPVPTNDRPLFEVKLSEFGYESRSGERRNQIALDFSDLNQIVGGAIADIYEAIMRKNDTMHRAIKHPTVRVWRLRRIHSVWV